MAFPPFLVKISHPPFTAIFEKSHPPYEGGGGDLDSPPPFGNSQKKEGVGWGSGFWHKNGRVGKVGEAVLKKGGGIIYFCTSLEISASL